MVFKAMFTDNLHLYEYSCVLCYNSCFTALPLHAHVHVRATVCSLGLRRRRAALGPQMQRFYWSISGPLFEGGPPSPAGRYEGGPLAAPPT